MALTTEQFVSGLVASCPEMRNLLDRHLQDYDEVLLHLLVADARRFAIAAFEAKDSDLLTRCLTAIAAGLSGEDDPVDNAVAVSFVEDTPWWDAQMSPFIATWPQRLRAEAERQRAATKGAKRHGADVSRRGRLLVSAAVGLFAGVAVGLALRLNFDRVSSDGIYLDRHIEAEWYKVAAAIVGCILIGVYLVAKGHAAEARIGTLAFVAPVLVMLARKLAVGRVVGANLWMLGWPMFAAPALLALLGCLALAERLAARKVSTRK